MELNKDVQLIVFEQISDTQVIEAKFQNVLHKIGFKAAMYFYQKILNKDPLGMILEKLEVIKVKDDLLHLDLNRWLGKQRSIIETLSKVHVNHAVLREAELVVLGNVNLAALFGKITDDEIDDWEIPVPDDDDEDWAETWLDGIDPNDVDGYSSEDDFWSTIDE